MLKSYLTKICAILGVATFVSSNLFAATFTVSNNQDSGIGSLRQAIADANAGGGGDITFSNVTGTITLATNLPLITASLNILGPGTNSLTVSGNNSNSIFQVSSNVSTTFSDFTIANSYTATKTVSGGHGPVFVNFPGSAISNAGAMTVLNCVVTNCVVNGGAGAVYSTGPLTMQNCLMIRCGSTSPDVGTQGGCIYSGGGLTLNNCTLTHSEATYAPGIFCGGATNILNNCIFSYLDTDYGEGDGGAIVGNNIALNSCIISNCGEGWNAGGILGGNITAKNTIIAGCDGYEEAGGLQLYGGNNYFYGCSILNNGANSSGGLLNYGNTTMLNCTISGNVAFMGQGAGIWNGGVLNLTNCTVSGNVCGQSGVPAGGGVYNITNSVVNLTDCTIVSNSAGAGPGGGVFNIAGGTVNATDTIIANNTSNDFTGALVSGGYNLIRNTTGWTMTGNFTGLQTGVDPMLGPLQNNGGFTMTHALLAGSPAIDAGPTNAAPNFDQRGLARSHGAADDIGAFEYGAVPFPAVVSLVAAGANSFHVTLAGSPLVTYSVLRAPSIAGPWTSIGSATTGCDGCCVQADTNAPAGSAFYQAVYPTP